MVYYCVVVLCINSLKNRLDLLFYIFLKDVKRRRVWKIFCCCVDKEFKILCYSLICKEYFKEDDFRKILIGCVELKNIVKFFIFKLFVFLLIKIECNDCVVKRYWFSLEREVLFNK